MNDPTIDFMMAPEAALAALPPTMILGAASDVFRFQNLEQGKRLAELGVEVTMKIFPGTECVSVPVADGGEGTVDALLRAMGGQRMVAHVTGPMYERETAVWGLLSDGTAVMEMAQASGLPCVSADTFSREVDFGIGTITWLPPEADAARWADAIEEAVSTGRADKAAVQRAVEEKGFDSDSFARKLCELYQNAPEGSKA
jgi:hypothetical protein